MSAELRSVCIIGVIIDTQSLFHSATHNSVECTSQSPINGTTSSSRTYEHTRFKPHNLKA